MSMEGAKKRGGGNSGLLLLGLGLYTVMMAYLLRVPCRVPNWNLAEDVPELCATVIGTATTVIAFNAGTIAAGQALEARGAFGARKNPLTATRLVGLVVIFLGVLAVRLL